MTDKAMTWQGPTLEIAGREYSVRRLGLVDIKWLAELLAGGTGYLEGLLSQKANLSSLSPEAIGSLILGYIPTAFDSIADWMAGLIGMSKADIRDPNVFPLGSEIQVIEAVVSHEDVAAFFDRALGLAKHPGLLSMMKRLQKPSTASKPATDGKTATSKAKT